MLHGSSACWISISCQSTQWWPTRYARSPTVIRAQIIIMDLFRCRCQLSRQVWWKSADPCITGDRCLKISQNAQSRNVENGKVTLHLHPESYRHQNWTTTGGSTLIHAYKVCRHSSSRSWVILRTVRRTDIQTHTRVITIALVNVYDRNRQCVSTNTKREI